MPSRIRRWSSTTRTRTTSDCSIFSAITYFLFFLWLLVSSNPHKQSCTLAGNALDFQVASHKLQALLHSPQTITLLVSLFSQKRGVKTASIVAQAQGCFVFPQLQVDPNLAGSRVLLNVGQ